MVKKGQLAIEFIIIVGFFLAILIPLLYMINNTFYNQIEKASINKLYESFSKLSVAIETVGNIGPGTALEVKIDIPKIKIIGIKSSSTISSIINKKYDQLYLEYETNDGRTISLVHASNYELEGVDLDKIKGQGEYNILVRSDEAGKIKVIYKQT
jgi:hypothetical protein